MTTCAFCLAEREHRIAPNAVRKSTVTAWTKSLREFFAITTVSPLRNIVASCQRRKGEYRNLLLKLHQQGYLRARIDGTMLWLEEQVELDKKKRHTIECVIDRLRVKKRKSLQTGKSGGNVFETFRWLYYWSLPIWKNWS